MSCHTSLKTPTLTLMNSRLIFYLPLTESLLSDHMNRIDDGFWPTTTGADFTRYGCLYSLICASPSHLPLSELYSLQQLWTRALHWLWGWFCNNLVNLQLIKLSERWHIQSDSLLPPQSCTDRRKRQYFFQGLLCEEGGIWSIFSLFT